MSASEHPIETRELKCEEAKRTKFTTANFESVDGKTIDYQEYHDEWMPKVVEMLIKYGVHRESIPYTLGTLGIWLQKSARNKRVVTRFFLTDKPLTLAEVSKVFGVTKQTINAKADILTTARLARILAPYASAFLVDWYNMGVKSRMTAMKLRTLTDISIAFSQPEFFAIVPEDAQKSFLEAVVKFEKSWKKSEKEIGAVNFKGRWSFKAEQYFASYPPMVVEVSSYEAAAEQHFSVSNTTNDDVFHAFSQNTVSRSGASSSGSSSS